jgi:hypothetical protein
MHHSFNRWTKYLFLHALLLAVFVCSVTAQNFQQPEHETKVTVLQQLDLTRRYGNQEGYLVIEENVFKELLTKEQNAALKELTIDFSTQTLIAVTVQGDCNISASVNLTRDDTTKKYLCRITKMYGGCRAAGTFQSWIVIEKIHPEYTVEFIMMKAEKAF